MSKHTYEEIYWTKVPDGLQFSCGQHLRGQIVEVEYGHFDPGEGADGDPYKRVRDRSVGLTWTYYKLVKPT